MADESVYLADSLEWTAETAAGIALEIVNSFLEEFGPRPMFAKAGTLLDQLQHYLKVRDDPLEWRAFIQQLVPGVGIDAAVAQAWREAMKMEAKLARYGGSEAVDRAVFIRDMAAAGRVIDRFERWAALPPVAVLPPARRVSMQEMVGERGLQ